MSQTQPSENHQKPPNSCFGSSLGFILGGFGRPLDASWPFLGASWALLGALGRLLGASWASLGRSWASLGCLLGLLGASWAHLGRSGIDFRRFQGGFERRMGSGPRNHCFVHIWNNLVAQPQMQDAEQQIFAPLPSNCNDATGPSITFSYLKGFPLNPKYRTPSFPASGLQSASAGCAKRKQFLYIIVNFMKYF